MQKDFRIYIGLMSIILFIVLILVLNNLIRPSKQIIYDINQIEVHLSSDNWAQIEYYFDDIKKLWTKYELLLKIINTPEHMDRFEELLSQSTTLIKEQNKSLIEYIPALKKLSYGVITSLPNP